MVALARGLKREEILVERMFQSFYFVQGMENFQSWQGLQPQCSVNYNMI